MSASTMAAPATNPIALLLPELDNELSVTRTFLAVVPWDQADWKPHARSMTLGKLATHLAQLPGFLTTMAMTDVLKFDPADFTPPVLASTEELLALFDAEVAKMREAMTVMDWAKLNGSWKMTMGEHTVIDNQRAYLLRHMGVNHLIHHRAQLGVYLRMQDVKIPGCYGPSADTM